MLLLRSQLTMQKLVSCSTLILIRKDVGIHSPISKIGGTKCSLGQDANQ